MSDLTDSNRSRQTYNSPTGSTVSINSTKLRASNVRLGRSQSQAELPFASKFSSPRQQQHRRTIVNGSIDIGVSPTPAVLIPSSNAHDTTTLPKMPPSSTTTALMMINKQYSNSPSTYVPTMSNHQPNNTKKISMYDKRYSNHT
jgi:hypothetical protein